MTDTTVFWQPGCSSCLRAKEFMTAQGIDFISINVREDKEAVERLARLGIHSVPIVMRGGDFVHGQDLDELARFVGVDPTRDKLSPDELIRRIRLVLAAAGRYVRQIPADVLKRPTPGRDRTALDLAYHVGVIPTAFLDSVRGGQVTFDHFERRAPAGASVDDVCRFLASVDTEVQAWWPPATLPVTLNTYYGWQPFHGLLERTAWHSMQHTRQLMAMVRNAGVTPNGPFTDADLAGLPLPQEVYDDQIKLTG